MKTLEMQTKAIAEKYAEFLEKRLTVALSESEADSRAISEINDGIRMLNHVVATLERICRLNREKEASGNPDESI